MSVVSRKSQNPIALIAFAGAALILSTGSSARAEVPEYTYFGLQARSNGIDGFNLPSGSNFDGGSPAISDSGVVTFRLLVVGSTGNAGLWYGSGGSGSVVYNATADRSLGNPAINWAGTVSFERSLNSISEGVFLYDPESGATVRGVKTGGPFGIDSFADPQINGSGQVGARVDLGVRGVQAYLVEDDGWQVQYALEGSNGVGFLFVPRFNEAAHLAGKVRLGGTAESQPDEIRRYHPGGAFTTIAVDQDSDAGSAFARFGDEVGLSDNGWVAFIATTVDGDGVYVSDGVTMRTIATEADSEISGIDVFRPVVNEDALVAFRGFDESGLRAIFAGDGATLRRVVTEHDILPTDLGDARVDQNDSSPVFEGNPAITANGDIAFAATLTPPGNDQIEWGTGMFVAYAGDLSGLADEGVTAVSGGTLTAQPNPFRDSVQFEWRASSSGVASTSPLTVYDPSGRLVRTLTPMGVRDGAEALSWDGRDGLGRGVPAGVYYVRRNGGDRETSGLKIVRLP